MLPIIFSAPMIRALLEGRKTQTRRLFKRDREPPPKWDGSFCFSALTPPRHVELRGYDDERGPLSRFMRLRYWNRDLLWVRETWKPHSIYAAMKPRDIPHTHVFYRSDDAYAPSNTPWVPAIHMPRWASRLTLEVSAVKIERLQAISDDDAVAEGCSRSRAGYFCGRAHPAHGAPKQWNTPREAYADLWKWLHGDDSWDANPEVVAPTFTVHKQNVDDFLRQREAA